MGKVTIKITHITWRAGRPRFIPGTNLRKMGYQGKDLKHPDGTWLGLEDCQKWSEELCQVLKQQRTQPTDITTPIKTPSTSSTGFATLGQVFADWFASPRFNNGLTTSGRRTRKPLAKASIDFYKKMSRHLERDHITLWQTPIAAIKTHHLEILYDRLDDKLGISVSTGIMKTLSAMFSFAVKHNMAKANPMRDIEIAKPQPNLRAGTIEEMQHLLKCADDLAMPQIGDSIMLGLMTGQRQGDRLQLTLSGYNEGRIFLKQQKTGALVDIPAMPALISRLEANKTRNAGNKINWPGIIIDEPRQRIYEPWRYRKEFQKVIQLAIKDMPSMADFKDKHLRKTCVTWLANAGCTNQEIAQITGHSPTSITEMLKHYSAPDPERADNAITKLENWLDKKGAEF